MIQHTTTTHLTNQDEAVTPGVIRERVASENTKLGKVFRRTNNHQGRTGDTALRQWNMR